MVKRATWLLFYIDRTSAMRWMTFPLLPDSIISYDLPRTAGDADRVETNSAGDRNMDQLASMVQYSRICEQINQQSLGSSPSLDAFSVLRLLDHLRSWYRSVPKALVDRLEDVTASNAQDRAESQMQLVFYLQYQEALLIIHDLVEKSPSTCSNLINEMDAQIGPDKVSRIVKHAPGILEHSSSLYVPTKVFCRVALDVLKSEADSNPHADNGTALVDLSLLWGYFAQNAKCQPTIEFFSKASELMSIVLQTVSSKRVETSS
ncbi:hypothetical protein QIS74_04104 [Colletotrichum tabaci]|uniref:Transcription factor domain-containing protein n=1 Tax=Colletotrichum tabaci TaxID=1209068 RepID=A0AAV9TKS5_9PEZI